LKLCYTSSIAAIGDEKPGTNITEESPWNPESDHSVYAITKYGAEMEVWRGTQEGLNAVIVNPGVILGAGFWHAGSGSLFRKVFNGLKYYTLGKTGFIDVHDVVNIMFDLMNSTITHERYILISENWTYKKFFQTVAQELNSHVPVKEAKSWLLNIGWKLDWLRYFLGNKRRRLTKQTAKSIQTESIYSNKKVKKALGVKFKPIKTSIEEVSQFFSKEF